MDANELANRFEFHPATSPDVQDAHAGVRVMCGGAADYLNEILPEGREKALAITKLEEAMMWANASIARNMNG